MGGIRRAPGWRASARARPGARGSVDEGVDGDQRAADDELSLFSGEKPPAQGKRGDHAANHQDSFHEDPPRPGAGTAGTAGTEQRAVTVTPSMPRRRGKAQEEK